MTKISFPYYNCEKLDFAHKYLRHYLLSDPEFKHTIDIDKNLRRGLASRGNPHRYQFFEIKIEKTICAYNFHDYPDLSLLTKTPGNIKVAFTCQLRPKDIDKCFHIYQKTGIRTYPFPMPLRFHTDYIFQKSYKNNPKSYLSHINFSTEYHRKHRIPFIKFGEKHSDIFNTEKLNGENFTNTITNDITWGINLRGLGNDFKCYRESEFMIMGCPFALNYTPFYPFDFIEGKHFIRLKTPEDMLQLKDINPKPFAEASYKIGYEYIRPNGVISLMQTLIDDKNYSIKSFLP